MQNYLEGYYCFFLIKKSFPNYANILLMSFNIFLLKCIFSLKILQRSCVSEKKKKQNKTVQQKIKKQFQRNIISVQCRHPLLQFLFIVTNIYDYSFKIN